MEPFLFLLSRGEHLHVEGVAFWTTHRGTWLPVLGPHTGGEQTCTEPGIKDDRPSVDNCTHTSTGHVAEVTLTFSSEFR